jgi:large subunit ribosomal protein L2
VVERLEYDPNRTAFIALIRYEDGEEAYILAPQRLQAGDPVIADVRVDVKPGNAAPIRNIPIGTVVHNVELKPGKGGQIARSAGAYAQIVGRDGDYTQIRLGSGEIRRVRSECIASIGAVSIPDHQNINYGKAGRSRWLGKRPHVRGGGDEPGRPSAWRRRGPDLRRPPSRHPLGQAHQGAPHRQNKKTQGMIIRSRHQAKKRGG